MNQSRRLQGLPGLLLGELLRRQLAQLVVDQREQLAGGGRIALFDGRQDSRDLIHRHAPTGPRWVA